MEEEMEVPRHEPKGIFSEEFRPCWYLVSIPGITIACTLLVVGVMKLARNYLATVSPESDPSAPAPAVVVEDFETGQVSHRTSISVGSQPAMVNLARRLSDVSNMNAVNNPEQNILDMYNMQSRPATAFNACRRTSCIQL